MSSPFIPPQNISAERAVLGACIRNSEALASAVEVLSSADFYDTNHRIIFGVMRDMFMADIPVDLVTLSNEMRNREILDRLGGQTFLKTLADAVTLTSNAGYHAKIVHENAIRRKLAKAGEEITKLALSYDVSLASIFEGAEKLLFEAEQNRSSNDFRHIKEIISPVLHEMKEKMQSKQGQLTGYDTGFVEMNSFTGGLQPGSLTILAARPSMGKTALALNIAQFGGNGTNGKNAPVLIFSLEMPASQLALRMISAESGIDLSKLTRGTLDTSEFELLRESANAVAQRNIFISDATQLSGLDLLARAKRFKVRHPDLSLIVVDYLQLMTSGEQGARTDNRQQEVSDISRMLKATARETDCPVIALSQLSREAEKRPDKKPQLADLRDSGAIEQDADVVMMLFREDYYTENEKNDLTDSKADVRIAKNRNGSTGVFHLTFRREITRFLNFGDEMSLPL